MESRKKWWDRLWAFFSPQGESPPDSQGSCSLCGRSQAVAGQLLEGCGHFICADCVVGDHLNSFVSACSFCQKPAKLVQELTGTATIAICNQCLARARRILYPSPLPVEDSAVNHRDVFPPSDRRR